MTKKLFSLCLILFLVSCVTTYLKPIIEKLNKDCYVIIRPDEMSIDTFITWILDYYNDHERFWDLEIDFVYDIEKNLVGALFWRK